MHLLQNLNATYYDDWFVNPAVFAWVNKHWGPHTCKPLLSEFSQSWETRGIGESYSHSPIVPVSYTAVPRTPFRHKLISVQNNTPTITSNYTYTIELTQEL